MLTHRFDWLTRPWHDATFERALLARERRERIAWHIWTEDTPRAEFESATRSELIEWHERTEFLASSAREAQ